VWLSIESLRADHVGCYGYQRDTTPKLDALAAEATVYENADAVTSWTLTSHATMFTGLYPSAHEVVRPKDRLADDQVTVAEVLRDAGYQTAAVVSGPYLSAAHNLQQGFDYVDESPIQHMQGASADITNPDMERAMFKYLHTQRDVDRPFMLFAYYWDTHSEYIPPPPYDTMFVPEGAVPIAKVQFMPAFQLGRHISQAQLDWLIAQYDGEVRCTDGYIGRVFDLLRQLDLWENTIIVVTADHGEEFYEHGRNSHKNTLYVESVRVPLIVKWPNERGPTPGRDDRLANLVDLYPTLLEVAGCKSQAPLNGRSLLAPVDAERPTFLELETMWSHRRKSTDEKWLERKAWTAVRAGRHKLVHIVPLEDREGEDMSPHWELYDTVADPSEASPLDAGAHAELFGELQGQLAEWREAMAILSRAWERGGDARLTPEEEQRLRGLGYLP
jgi:arylsulfatase A-like enzyme